MYPDTVGIVAFKNGSYEIDAETPTAAPNTIYYNQRLVLHLIKCLKSIADNTCCSGCQEAKIVAKSALERFLK
jgi:hypothetical protein